MNKGTITGRLTKDPELRFTNTNGIPVCNFTIANETYNSSTKEKEAEFYDIVAWRNLAENLSKYQQKGSMILVEYHLEKEVRNFGDKNVKIIGLVADNIEFMESKKTSDKIEITPEQHEEPKKNVNIIEDDLPF